MNILNRTEEKTMMFMSFDRVLVGHIGAALLYAGSELTMKDLLDSMGRSMAGIRDEDQEPELVYPFSAEGAQQLGAALHMVLNQIFDSANVVRENPLPSENRVDYIREICTVAASIAANTRLHDKPPEGPTRNDPRKSAHS